MTTAEFTFRLLSSTFLWVITVVFLHHAELSTPIAMVLATITMGMSAFVSHVFIDLLKKW